MAGKGGTGIVPFGNHGIVALRTCLQASGHGFCGFQSAETAGEDGDEGDSHESDEAGVRAIEDRVQPPIATEPSERALDDPADFGRDELAVGATHLGLDVGGC